MLPELRRRLGSSSWRIHRREGAPQPDGIPGLLPAAEALVNSEIPVDVINKQIGLYTPETAQVSDVRRFNPTAAIARISNLAGRSAIAIDAGGKKIVAEILQARENGRLKRIKQIDSLRSENGEGYRNVIDKIIRRRKGGRGFAVGFSVAGKINGTIPEELTNLHSFQDDLAGEPYNGDLANGFPNAISIDGDNDAVTGTVASAVEVARTNPNIKKVLFYINGGGVGGAAWVDGVIKRAEPGHVQVIDELNPFNKNIPCKQKGSPTPDLTCVENMSASGAGIEKIYALLRPLETKTVGGKQVPLEGEDIERKYLEGDELATQLIDNASILAAAEILGLDKATHQNGESYTGFNAETTAIVCHGGFFRYQGVRERVQKIIEKMTGSSPTILYSDDFTKETSGNACADGAAILALNAV